MTEGLHLARAPIVEAVVDINCDLSPGIDFSTIQERATEALSRWYPEVRRQIRRRREPLTAGAGPSEVAIRHQVTGLTFLSEDEKQIVQFRGEGYSFNRLAPYGSLDDYLVDIERSWNIFRELAMPVQIRSVGLRFINRILLPVVDGRVELKEYLRVSPQLPDQETLELSGFLNQHAAIEVTTGNHVNIILATEPPENDRLPIIFDIDASDLRSRLPEQWQGVKEAILSLRRLKNRVFERTLTEACLNLFRQP